MEEQLLLNFHTSLILKKASSKQYSEYPKINIGTCNYDLETNNKVANFNSIQNKVEDQ